MSHRLVLCVVLGGCSFRASATGDHGPMPPVDGAAGDVAMGDAAGATDAAIDTPAGATDCFARWLAGNPTISAPQEITGLSTGGSERDPWLSDDGFTLYFSRNPGTQGLTDVYRATRTMTTQAFANGAAVTNLNRSDTDDGRVSLGIDDTLLVMSSNRDGGQFKIYLSARPNTVVDFGSPNNNYLNNVNAGTANNFDPFLSADGKTLYFAPLPQTGSQHIFIATRASLSSDFSTPAAAPAINSSSIDADPALSLDQRVIVFSSTRPGGVGGTDLWYATRSSTAVNFDTPKLMPIVNTAFNDGDPVLSADGCELYFSSTRTGADYDLYSAQITK